MAIFEQTIKKAVDTINNWPYQNMLQSVTIIRDISGKLSFLLSMPGGMEDTKKQSLDNLLRTALKKYYQGNIYCKENRNNDLVEAMISEIELLRREREADGSIHWYLLERAIAKKAWVECSNSETAVWSYEDAVDGNKPKVVTFYSFKGGMGRTTALAATALSLAKEGKNVLAIDTDIEAPGLASLFFDENSITGGVVDYILEASVTPEDQRIDMSTILKQVMDPLLLEEVSGQIFVIPSGVVDEHYLQKLARIDYQDAIPNNMKKQLSRLIEDAVTAITVMCPVDYVLLDSRAGFHDMGGVITTQMPHGVVLFGKDSKQSWQGMELVLDAISTSQSDKPLVAIVDGAWGREGIISLEEREKFSRQAYTAFCENYYSEEYQPGPEALSEPHSPIFVSYKSLIAGDIVLYSDGAERNNEMLRQVKQVLLGEEYQAITKRIQQWFGKDEGV